MGRVGGDPEPGQGQFATVVGLYQHAERIGTAGGLDAARRRADASLEAEGDGASAGADGALGHWPRLRRLDGRDDLLDGGPAGTNVVEAGVVGLSDHGIERHDALVARLAERPAVDGLNGPTDRQRVGEHDRRFDLAELLHLRCTSELAEAVEHCQPGRQLVAAEIAVVRHDGRGAGAQALALDHRHLTDANAGHVGDGVERAGWQ